MNKAIRKVPRFAISVGLLAFLAWRTDWARIGHSFAHLHIEFWFGAVGLYILSQTISSYRWQLLAAPLGFGGSLVKFARIYFIGMYFNLLLPTSVGGDVVRSWLLDNRPGKRLTALASVLVDRASGLFILLLVGCVGMAFCPVPVPAWIPIGVWGTAATAAVGILALPFIVRITDRWERLRKLADISRVYIRHPWLVLGTSALSCLVQALNVGLAWLVGRAIDAPVPGAFYWVFVPMVSLLTVLPVSLNGMGIREGSTVLFLAPLGVSSSDALSLAMLWFTVLAVSSLLGGGVYLAGPIRQSEVEDATIRGDSDQGRAGQSQAAA